MPLEEEEDSSMEDKMEHQNVPVTTSSGEVKLVSSTQAQVNRAKADVMKEYKHCKVAPKSRICGKGSVKSKGKQPNKCKGKTGKGKGGKGKSQQKGKKQVSGSKKKTPGKKKQPTIEKSKR